MRLIADGVVDREGVDGLARRLGYSARQLNRLVTGELGAGPLALRPGAPRADRAGARRDDRPCPSPTSRSRPASPASGSSTTPCARCTPRRRPSCAAGAAADARPPGTIATRIGVREPFAGAELLRLPRAARGAGGRGGRAGLVRALPRAAARPGRRARRARSTGPTATCLPVHAGRRPRPRAALERTRRLLDADCDPIAVDEELGERPAARRRWSRRRPGLRVPGHVDGVELAVRAVLGQQVTVAGARTLAARLVADARHARSSSPATTG